MFVSIRAASNCAKELAQRSDKQNPILPYTIVVDCARHAILLAVDFFGLEAEFAMKGDRGAIDWRGDTANCGAAARAGGREEALVELAAQAATAMLGVDADKMDVGLAGECLRNKASQKSNEFALLLGGKAGVLKVDKKELRQHIGHVPAAPPLVDHGDHRWVVALV